MNKTTLIGWTLLWKRSVSCEVRTELLKIIVTEWAIKNPLQPRRPLGPCLGQEELNAQFQGESVNWMEIWEAVYAR
jgi:hypothetical protein